MINFIWSWVIVLKVYFQDKSRLKLLMCFSPFPFVFFGSGIEFDNDKALPGSSVLVIRRPISDLGLPGLWLESLWRNSYRCDHEFEDLFLLTTWSCLRNLCFLLRLNCAVCTLRQQDFYVSLSFCEFPLNTYRLSFPETYLTITDGLWTELVDGTDLRTRPVEGFGNSSVNRINSVTDS